MATRISPVFSGLLILLFGTQLGHGGILISHYSFDSAAGFTDSGPGANDGTGFGGAAITTTPGEFMLGDGALSLDGVNDYLSIDNFLGDLPDSADFSVSVWFRGSSPLDILLSANGSVVYDNNYLFGLNASGQILSHVGGGIDGSGVGSTGLADDNYHFAVATYEALTNTHRLYVDNVFQGSNNPAAGAITWSTATTAQIGMERDGAVPTDHWSGFIDDLAIYSGQLTVGEIDGLWNGGAGATVPEASESLVILLGVTGLVAVRRRKRQA